MKPVHLFSVFAMAAILSACATQPAPMQRVREFAAVSAKLDAFAELSAHYRDTYPREQPYLSASADQQERQSDAMRRAAYGDFMRIQKLVVLYLDTLGKLSGTPQFDLDGRVKNVVGGIKAWPGSGIDTVQASAYTRLGQYVAGALGASAQQTAATSMLHNGAEPLQHLLGAMIALLRYYDKTSDNESKIVLGLFEVELPFLELSQGRLLSALAQVRYAEKKSEYGAIGRRLALAEKHLQAVALAHLLLLQEMGITPPQPGGAAPVPPAPAHSAATPLQQALRAVVDSETELNAFTH